VLESAALAHLVTLNEDGSPQVSIVWVGLDGDEIVAGPSRSTRSGGWGDSHVQRDRLGVRVVIFGVAFQRECVVLAPRAC
jgi:hypothetical protein